MFSNPDPTQSFQPAKGCRIGNQSCRFSINRSPEIRRRYRRESGSVVDACVSSLRVGESHGRRHRCSRPSAESSSGVGPAPISRPVDGEVLVDMNGVAPRSSTRSKEAPRDVPAFNSPVAILIPQHSFLRDAPVSANDERERTRAGQGREAPEGSLDARSALPKNVRPERRVHRDGH
jgi:hypothetical protein